MLGETEKNSDVCRTASLSEMGHEQRAAASSTVTDHRRKNFCVLVARPRQSPTLSNPVLWQNWMADYLGYTLNIRRHLLLHQSTSWISYHSNPQVCIISQLMLPY